MNYYVWTIGCQYNEWDSARIRYFLDCIGLNETKANEANLIVILACAVRQTAVDRILGRVKNWPEKKIVVTGCVLESDKDKLYKKGLTVLESGDIKSLFKFISNSLNQKFEDFTLRDLNKFLSGQNSQSMYIPITMGCNNFCSYCAVPYTRGSERSRPMEEVVNDARVLIEKGYKEIMLLGQNVNSYVVREKDKRRRTMGKTDFTILLERLNDLDGDFMISFTSNHPKDMTNDIITAVATLPKIKEEIHLPLQSGSDKILKAMNRPYTISKYLDIVQKIKTANPEIKISTDVIVGFPGETEADFQKTVEVFKQVDYDVAYINKYSPRKGTVAYELGNPISWKEKQRRWHILNELVENNPKIPKMD